MYDETLRARRRFLLSSLRSISDNQVSQNSIRRAIQTHDGIPDQSTRASVISVVKFIKTEVEVEVKKDVEVELNTNKNQKTQETTTEVEDEVNE